MATILEQPEASTVRERVDNGARCTLGDLFGYRGIDVKLVSGAAAGGRSVSSGGQPSALLFLVHRGLPPSGTSDNQIGDSKTLTTRKLIYASSCSSVDGPTPLSGCRRMIAESVFSK